jgi:hypothetical protein
MKRCPDCQRTRPLSDFPRNRNRADGLGFYCKLCMNLRTRLSRERRLAAVGGQQLPPYQRRQRLVPTGQKYCPRCELTQPVENFGRNRAAHDGLTAYCRPCHNIKVRESKDRNGGFREYHLRRRYGIGAAQVDAMIDAQGGTCAVCPGKPEHVDHDHVTGKVRGILCFNCNQALGNARDDPRVLIGLVRYLREHGVGQLRLVAAPSHLELVLADYLHGHSA